MENLIEEFLIFKRDLTRQLREYVNNKNIPLEKRWKLFLDSDLGYDCWYRFETDTFDFSDFYSQYNKSEITYAGDIIIFLKDELVDENTINTIKEEILLSFHRSYENN